jgi:hypothetical protein
MKKLLIIPFLFLVTALSAQDVQRSSNRTVVDDSLKVTSKLVAPADTTQKANGSIVVFNANPYYAWGGYYHSFGSGSGTLTGAGNLSPLFTTGVSGANITFSLSNAAAHTVLGNYTGSSAGSTYGNPTELELSTSDITTLNASTSKHGFLKKLNNDATYYMDGTGNWSIPPGTGGGGGSGWALTGNSGLTPVTNFIGTTDNISMRFRTNNVERIILDSLGLLSINRYAIVDTIYGNTTSAGNLTLSSTSHATKGKIIFGSSAYDEVNNRLGITTASPASLLDLSTGYNVSNFTFRTGDFAVQPLASNNTIIGSNIYYNGGWNRITNGNSAMGFQFNSAQILAVVSGSGSGTYTPTFAGKFDASNGGSFTAGGSVTSAAGSYTGATMVVFGTNPYVGINNTNPQCNLDVSSFNVLTFQTRIGVTYLTQSYDTNNNITGNNGYFNGTNFVRSVKGTASFQQYAKGEIRYFVADSGAAGSTITQLPVVKLLSNGTAGIGGGMSQTIGSIAGATLTATASAVGIGNTSPDASALLDLTSTTKALLLPRMTKAQRDAMVSPVAGDEIWQTDNTPGPRWYDGTNWNKVALTAD